jgi:ABC-type molybdate transport system permease subunit
MTQTSISIIVAIIALIIILWLYIFLPIRMARKRERSALGWVLLFWILSPLWGIIILLILGDSKQKIRKDIMKDLKRN